MQNKDFTKLYHRIQCLLIFSNICALYSYIFLIMVVARLYACFEGKQRFLMLESLGAIYALLAILLWFAWKDTFSKEPDSSNVESDNLNSLISKNKKLSYCLMVYATSFVAANIFFFLDHKGGLTLILKLSTPLGVIVFLAGIYFITKFKGQERDLQSYGRPVRGLK